MQLSVVHSSERVQGGQGIIPEIILLLYFSKYIFLGGGAN